MGVHREDLERGGTVYLRAGQFAQNQAVKRRRAFVVDIQRGACRIRMEDDGTERTIRFCDLDPDDEFLRQREERQQQRRERIAREGTLPSSPPLAVKLPLPRLVAVAKEPEMPPEVVAAEITRRFVLVIKWVSVTKYEDKFGSQSKSGAELGLNAPLTSQLLTGKTGISLNRALQAAGKFGFDLEYFTGPFVPPEEYQRQRAQQKAPELEPVELRVPEFVRAEPLPFAETVPAPKPEATPEPTPEPEAAPQAAPPDPADRGEFESWLEMGRNVLDSEINACATEWKELNDRLQIVEARMAKLQKKRTTFLKMFAKLEE